MEKVDLSEKFRKEIIKRAPELSVLSDEQIASFLRINNELINFVKLGGINSIDSAFAAEILDSLLFTVRNIVRFYTNKMQVKTRG